MKFAALFMFSDTQADMALKRLKRLQAINPSVTFIPVMGVRQFLYVPMIVDGFIFGSTKKLHLIGPVSHFTNWFFLGKPGVFKMSCMINEWLGSFVRRGTIMDAKMELQKQGLPQLHADFTPLVLWNLDHAIMDWYSNNGQDCDFDYLIFYESDVYTTKPLEEIFEPYAKKYDACFNDFEEATPNWFFYNFPVGAHNSMTKWLRQRSLPTKSYKSVFSGNLISRQALVRLAELKIDFSGDPSCQAEMRLPTILSALGFKCGKFDFPLFRYRPQLTGSEIRSHNDAGIFHPVKNLMPEEQKECNLISRRLSALKK